MERVVRLGWDQGENPSITVKNIQKKRFAKSIKYGLLCRCTVNAEIN
jgi:hypothetical protein